MTAAVSGLATLSYKEAKNDHTSCGTQVHLHESEQVFGGVAHEFHRSEVPSTMALP